MWEPLPSMRKRERLLSRVLFPGLAVLAFGCSGGPVAKDGFSQEEINMVSRQKSEVTEPETGTSAPGMIPADCEALLNKSQAWGYVPGQKWKPANPEQAMEAAKFFGEFRLVPLATSNVLREIENGGAMPKASEALPCDPYLAQSLLEPVLAYPWGKAARLEAGKSIHRFLLNQQSLVMPLLQRAVTGRAFAEAVRQGLVPGSHAKAKAFVAWMDKEIAGFNGGGPIEASSPELSAKVARNELMISGRIRDRIGGLLPLP